MQATIAATQRQPAVQYCSGTVADMVTFVTRTLDLRLQQESEWRGEYMTARGHTVFRSGQDSRTDEPMPRPKGFEASEGQRNEAPACGQLTHYLGSGARRAAIAQMLLLNLYRRGRGGRDDNYTEKDHR